MEREIYATDGEITIYHLSEDDMEEYLKLYFGNEEIDEFIKRIAFKHTDNNYSIYDKNDEYCGNLDLQNPNSNTPEFGIELVENKRNQGIGPKAIKLFAKDTYNRRNIKYFILRAKRSNTHSRHVLEKLGCTYVETEPNRIKEYVAELEKIMERPLSEKAKKIALSPPDENEEIMIYKYMPDAFLDKQ